jgi:hypothetical protein
MIGQKRRILGAYEEAARLNMIAPDTVARMFRATLSSAIGYLCLCKV